MNDAPFTNFELDYLAAQRLGRLATVSPAGAPQNNPVGFVYNEELGTIDVFGLNLAATRKYRNVVANGQVALVVDDLASVDPWEVRGIEIRGVAEALDGVGPSRSGMSPQVIRIHPRRIISWNVDPARTGMSGRNVADDVAAV
jgi:pyridoxamine 5'-phosphate oxidase family protein